MGVLMRNGIVEGIYTDRKYPSIKIGDKFFSANLDYGKPVVDLRKFQEGDEVEFDVTKNGDYENIIEIKKMGDVDTSFDHGANKSEPQQTYTPEPVRTAIPNDANRNIFVTGVVGRAMGSGNFQIQDIDALTSMAMATYNKYFI